MIDRKKAKDIFFYGPDSLTYQEWKVKQRNGYLYLLDCEHDGIKYNKWLPVSELADLPFCVVDVRTLTNRVCSVVKAGETKNLKTLYDCLTYVDIRSQRQKKEREQYSKVERIFDEKPREEFIQILNLFKPGSLSNKVIL